MYPFFIAHDSIQPHIHTGDNFILILPFALLGVMLATGYAIRYILKKGNH